MVIFMVAFICTCMCLVYAIHIHVNTSILSDVTRLGNILEQRRNSEKRKKDLFIIFFTSAMVCGCGVVKCQENVRL